METNTYTTNSHRLRSNLDVLRGLEIHLAKTTKQIMTSNRWLLQMALFGDQIQPYFHSIQSTVIPYQSLKLLYKFQETNISADSVSKGGDDRIRYENEALNIALTHTIPLKPIGSHSSFTSFKTFPML